MAQNEVKPLDAIDDCGALQKIVEFDDMVCENDNKVVNSIINYFINF